MGDQGAAPWIQSIVALNPRGASSVNAWQNYQQLQLAKKREAEQALYQQALMKEADLRTKLAAAKFQQEQETTQRGRSAIDRMRAPVPIPEQPVPYSPDRSERAGAPQVRPPETPIEVSNRAGRGALPSAAGEGDRSGEQASAIAQPPRPPTWDEFYGRFQGEIGNLDPADQSTIIAEQKRRETAPEAPADPAIRNKIADDDAKDLQAWYTTAAQGNPAMGEPDVANAMGEYHTINDMFRKGLATSKQLQDARGKVGSAYAAARTSTLTTERLHDSEQKAKEQSKRLDDAVKRQDRKEAVAEIAKTRAFARSLISEQTYRALILSDPQNAEKVMAANVKRAEELNAQADDAERQLGGMSIAKPPPDAPKTIPAKPTEPQTTPKGAKYTVTPDISNPAP